MPESIGVRSLDGQAICLIVIYAMLGTRTNGFELLNVIEWQPFSV
jgi:hypothetical protein